MLPLNYVFPDILHITEYMNKGGRLRPGDKMSQTLDILGLQIEDYGAFEAIELVKEYLNNDLLNTIELLTPELLVEAEEDDVLREAVGAMDLCMLQDKEILKILEINNPKREAEVENRIFLISFMTELQKEDKSAFLLCESEEELETFYGYMQEHYPKIRIAGCIQVTDTEDEDGIVNDINAAAPDVILAALSVPFQQEFISRNKLKINAKVWMGLGKNCRGLHDVGIKTSWLNKMIEKSILKRKITKYRDQEKETEK